MFGPEPELCVEWRADTYVSVRFYMGGGQIHSNLGYAKIAEFSEIWAILYSNAIFFCK